MTRARGLLAWPRQPVAPRRTWRGGAGTTEQQFFEGLARDGREHRELAERMGAAERQGAAPGDDAVQVLVAEHHAGVAVRWTPDRSAYRGLADTCVGDERSCWTQR